METYNYLEAVTTANTQEKTMVQLENQAYRLTEKNWGRRNVWESSEASRAAKIGRDKLICRAYMSAAAKHLTAKAKDIDEHLSVWPLSDMSGLVLDYNTPSVGVSLLVSDAFSLESFLNAPDKVIEELNA